MSTTSIARHAGTYSVDRDHSSVGFAVRHMGISTFRGAFKTFDAAIAVLDDGALKLAGSVPVASISVDSPADLRAHLLGAEFFDAERHPVIAFESDAAHPDEGGAIVVEGCLTMRNITRSIVAKGNWSGPIVDPYGAVRAALELTTTIDRRDYAMTWNAALPRGGDALGTRVTLTVQLELIGD